MKIRVKRLFDYMVGTETKRLEPGIYEVPGDIDNELARKVLRWGSAEKLAEKKAPENKVVKTPKSKARVAASTVHSSRPRTKPNARGR